MDAKNIQFLVEKAKNDILQEVNDRLPERWASPPSITSGRTSATLASAMGASAHGSAHVGRTPILPMPSTRCSPRGETTSCDP